MPTPQFTTWSGSTIDFIFIKQNHTPLSIADCKVYFSGASDHIPVIMNITK